MHDILLSNPLIILYRAICPCSKDRDVFKEYKPLLARRFKTPEKRFFYFLTTFLLCCIASGPLNSWVTIEPLLGELHVLNSTYNHSSSALNEVQVIGFSFGSLLSIPLGLSYDIFGPRASAAMGALFAALGTLCMAIAISNAKFNWILFIAYPMASLGGSMNSMAILGYQWLMPQRQNLVNSMYGASLAISDTIAILGVSIINSGAITLQTFFFIIAGVSMVVAILTYLGAPSKAENSLHYLLVVEGTAEREREKSNYDSIDATTEKCDIMLHDSVKNSDSNIVDSKSETISRIKEAAIKAGNTSTFREVCKQSWIGISGTAKIFKHFPVPLILSQLFICMIYWSAFYPMASMYNYYVMLLGVNDAVVLVDAFSVIYGVTGSILTIFAGWLCDKVGLVKFLRYTVCLLILTASLQMVPIFSVQLLWIFLWTMCFNLFLIIYVRLSMHYAPMEYFGTFQGVLGTCMVVPQLLGSGALRTYLTKRYGNSVEQYTYAYVPLNIITIIVGIALSIYWIKYPPPKVGEVVEGENGKIYASQEDMEADLSRMPLLHGDNVTYSINEIKGTDSEYSDYEDSEPAINKSETFF